MTPAEWLEAEFDKMWLACGTFWEDYSFELEQYVTRYSVFDWNIDSPGAMITVKEDATMAERMGNVA
jgi:hypothetical protein